MAAETCFVVMAIGEQSYDSVHVTAAELLDLYSSAIKKAILKARPGVEITCSNELSNPGETTTEVLRKLMFSTFVIVDITYPDPNVFYALGIRHACKCPGTILIRNGKVAKATPFDVTHHRFLEYQPTGPGVPRLANALRERFAWHDKIKDFPAGEQLSLANLSQFTIPQ